MSYPNYVPTGNLTGTLRFPQGRLPGGAVLMRVENAPPEAAHLIGEFVELGWSDQRATQEFVKFVTTDVKMGRDAQTARKMHLNLPERLDGLESVGPLESLAAGRVEEDVQVSLLGSVELDGDQVRIHECPLQIRGRSRCVARVERLVEDDRFEIRHFDRQTGDFTGDQEIVRIPQVEPRRNGTFPSTNREIHDSPLNEAGWYFYGEHDEEGLFTVGALEPRASLLLEPERVVIGREAGRKYLRNENWESEPSRKGRVNSVLVDPDSESEMMAVREWKEGDRGLVIHLFGGMKGDLVNDAKYAGFVAGHFSYGEATVVRDVQSGDLRFDIIHRQVYGVNEGGILSGPSHWSCYVGDMKRGWLGSRPISDVVVKFPALTETFKIGGMEFCAMNELTRELNEMSARYRTGDGDGAPMIGIANSCVQDSNQALFSALCEGYRELEEAGSLGAWMERNPQGRANIFAQLKPLADDLYGYLTSGGIRKDWKRTAERLHTKRQPGPILTVYRALRTPQTVLPRAAFDDIVEIFLKHGAKLWFVRTNQAGGIDPSIYPLAPTVPFRTRENRVKV